MNRDDILFVVGVLWIVNLGTWLFLKIGEKMYKK